MYLTINNNMSAYEDDSHFSLGNTFKNMLSPQKATQNVVEESVKREESPKRNKKFVRKTIEEDLDKFGSKFNDVFKKVFVEQYDEEYDDSMDGPPPTDEFEDEEDYEFEDEEEMVSVPVAAIKELYAYIEDTMGPEDESDIENLDIELEESDNSGAPKQLPNRMGDLQKTGNPYQSDKIKTCGVGKTGHVGGNSKDKSGNPVKLLNLLGQYLQKGSHYQSHKKVGEVPVKN